MSENNKDEAVWNIRVKRTLDNLVEGVVEKDTHSTKSEFIRQAVREKLEKMGVSFNMDDLKDTAERETS